VQEALALDRQPLERTPDETCADQAKHAADEYADDVIAFDRAQADLKGNDGCRYADA